MPKQILTKQTNEQFTITLNNPAKRNCIGLEMLAALNEALAEAESNDSIRGVVVRGAGGQAFSSGGNTREFSQLEGKEVGHWIERGHAAFNRLESLKKPTVAFIDGYALGGGLELALACDFRIGTEQAVLGCPEVANGWLPGWGGMVRLRRLVGEVHAKKLVLLSTLVPAHEAVRMGLLTEVATEAAETRLHEFVQQLATIKPAAYALAKAALTNAHRSTTGSDVQFDVLAVQIARE